MLGSRMASQMGGHSAIGPTSWCPEGDLNPHGPVMVLRILSPLCLPISPSGPVSFSLTGYLAHRI